MDKLIINNQKILVVGLAKSGIPTVDILAKLGAKITINDIKKREDLQDVIGLLKDQNLKYILGEHPENVSQYDIIVLSPGVPTDLPFIKEAKEKNLCVIGELELAYRLCNGSFVAITGTNGKTTTTALTGQIFKNAQRESYVVGNIGVAAISKSLDCSKEGIMVTEVSSFQLESIVEFKPHIAAVLNITPDHLNRHKTMENYIMAKANIFINQKENDFLVLNGDDSETMKLATLTKSTVIPFSRTRILERGVFVLHDQIVVKEEAEEPQIVCNVEELKIPGNHNLENALAATAIAYWADIDKEVIANTLKTFMGVEHRTEIIDEIDGVLFVNDSKGTNPDASIKAVEAIKTPILLIAGGMDKGSEFEEFIEAFDNKVKHMFLLGETAEKIKKTAEKKDFYDIMIVKDMEEAVNQAFELATEGDTILLSPACASWDMYKSFEHRGEHFKECVKKLRRSH